MTRRQQGEQDGVGREKRIGADEERIGSLLHESGKRRFNLALGAGLQNEDSLAEGASRFQELLQLDFGLGVSRT